MTPKRESIGKPPRNDSRSRNDDKTVNLNRITTFDKPTLAWKQKVVTKTARANSQMKSKEAIQDGLQ